MVKKIKNSLLVCIAFVVLLTTLYLNFSYASSDRAYSISKYDINANVHSNADMSVEEILTYDFRGSFNGILRDIRFDGAEGITNLKIYSYKNNNQLQEYQRSSSNESGTYLKTLENNMVKLKIFSPSINESKVFKIKYTLIKPANKYQDIAELYWKFIGDEWKCDINNITINIQIPKGALKPQLRIFAHGPLTGESQVISEQKVQLKLSQYVPGDFVEARLLFPTQTLVKAQTIPASKLQSVLVEEKNWAEDANAIREKAREEVRRSQNQEAGSGTEGIYNTNEGITSGLNISSGLILLILIGIVAVPTIIAFIIMFNIYKKYDKELRPDFKEQYFRDLPGNYTPAEMNLLMHSKYKSTTSLTATLMDLVRRKVLTLEVDKKIRHGFFGDKEEEEYLFRRNFESTEELTEHERLLISWFINEI